MALACHQPLPLYRPRDPQASDLWRLIDQHFDSFRQVYDERFQAKYGFWRPVVDRSVTAFLACGDLAEGFARVRCPDCHHEMFVAYSCKQRCACPSCHQKRTLLTALHVAQEVSAPVAHRQVVLTIPKRLRLHARFDRSLLGIEPEVVENMRTWEHSGFSVDQSVLLAAGDQAGIERLVQYMTRCPFSLARLVKVSDSGQVVYKAEKAACRSFPDPGGDGLQAGTKRNYQILSPLDFLAEFTQHIPAKGSHLIRYYGWYSNKSRGMRKKAAAARSAAEPSATVGAEEVSPSRSRQSWAMLIKRVYEIDPLSCPECGGQMAVVAFIEPPQEDVIEKILRHCGLWPCSAARPPPANGNGNGVDGADRPDTEPHELTYVDMDTFLANF